MLGAVWQAVYNAVTEFMTEHRGLFVTIFVLPVSLLFDVFFRVRAWIVFKFYSAPKLHARRVQGISAQVVRAMKDTAQPGGTKLCTSRGGWQSISPSLRPYKRVATTIDVNLYDILSLDSDQGVVHVEPMVNMGQLSHFLVPYGLTIPILPEMDDLTVGGLFMGVGIETSSHLYGLFNDTVVEAEVVLADGSVVTCSRDSNRDLFDALPWSYGTLGFLVSCKIQVIPCKPFVRIEYIPCRTREESERVFAQHVCAQDDPADFVEALAYSRDTMVVMPARFADASEVDPAKRNDIGTWHKPWFYKHVQGFLDAALARSKTEPPEQAPQPTVEYIPLRDYYHRHTKSIFWELEQIIPWGNQAWFRWLLGWAVPPKVSFLKLTQTAAIRKLYEEQHIIQDMLVPLDRMGAALDEFHERYDIYPLWVCPHRLYDYGDAIAPHRHFLRKPAHAAALPDDCAARRRPAAARAGASQHLRPFEMYVDLGAYGVPRACLEKRPFDVVETSRKVEAFVEKERGFQMLYATSYQTREEFRSMFDHAHYDHVKAKVDPLRAFPEIYDKVCKGADKMWKQRAETAGKKYD